MAATANDVLNVARGWIGYSENNGKYKEILNVYNENTTGYNMAYSDAWCDCFVSACAIKAKATDIIGTEVGCNRHIDIFKKKGIWIEDGSVTPKEGDIILFNWDDSTQPNDGSADHIGFVEKVSGNTITCIEGNMSDAVGRRSIPIGWGYIRGFARPKYASSVANTSTAVKTIEQIAKEVIDGKWGNGTERKNALTKAGYNYTAVQVKIGDILGTEKSKKLAIVAKEVIDGKWGNGASRKTALANAGYSYEEVQAKVNDLLKKEK